MCCVCGGGVEFKLTMFKKNDRYHTVISIREIHDASHETDIFFARRSNDWIIIYIDQHVVSCFCIYTLFPCSGGNDSWLFSCKSVYGVGDFCAVTCDHVSHVNFGGRPLKKEKKFYMELSTLTPYPLLFLFT